MGSRRPALLLVRAVSVALVGLVYLVLASITQVQAQTADFRTQLTAEYNVSVSGQTHVTYHFQITNLTPTRYINKYAINLASVHLKNIRATEKGVYLQPHVVEADNQTSVALDFKQPVVGLNQVRDFTIEYDTDTVADVAGQVLEINIPKVVGDGYDTREVIVRTPAQFGLPTYLQPDTNQSKQQGQQVTTRFTKLKNLAVTLIFGKEQTFDVSLRYDLDNHSQSTEITQIALPPDTHYQQVYYHSLDPEPLSLTQDKEGNWLASYQLDPTETKTIYASLTLKTTLEPNNLPLPQPNFKQYLRATEFWQTNDPRIKQVTTQHHSFAELYHYTVNQLDYSTNLAQHQRMGAVRALTQPDQVACEEFSDLLITLSRAHSIPARRVVGYAYSNSPELKPAGLTNQDVLHAWVEYLDNSTKKFIPVDPTWEKTTGGRDYLHHFDLNHLAFAINGLNDHLPLPAGAYTNQDSDQAQNISVELGHQWPTSSPNFSVELVKNRFSFPGIYQLVIKNETGSAWYQTKTQFHLSSQKTKILPLTKVNQTFLPYETQTIKLLVMSRDLTPHKVNLGITISLKDNQTYQTGFQPKLTALPTFGLESFSRVRWLGLGLAGGVILILIIGTLLTKLR